MSTRAKIYALKILILASFITLSIGQSDNLVDLIEGAGLWEEPDGVLRILGRCANYTPENIEPARSDWAYRFSERAQISLSTSQFFPTGFPQDFSILLVVRPSPGQMSSLFTIYSDDGDEQLSITVGKDISMYYEDTEGLPEEGNFISFGESVDDGEWHRIAFSVKGDSASLIADCHRIVTRQLPRPFTSQLSTAGIINIGYELIDEGYYNGDVQMLKIASTPEEAYELCNRYARDCIGIGVSGSGYSSSETYFGSGGSFYESNRNFSFSRGDFEGIDDHSRSQGGGFSVSQGGGVTGTQGGFSVSQGGGFSVSQSRGIEGGFSISSSNGESSESTYSYGSGAETRGQTEGEIQRNRSQFGLGINTDFGGTLVGPDLSGSYNISITGSGSTDETQTVIEESVTSGNEDYG